jgi:hypothetical protein
MADVKRKGEAVGIGHDSPFDIPKLEKGILNLFFFQHW